MRFRYNMEYIWKLRNFRKCKKTGIKTKNEFKFKKSLKILIQKINNSTVRAHRPTPVPRIVTVLDPFSGTMHANN